MKKILFVITFLITSVAVFGQLNYKGWQMKDPMYGYDHYAPHDFVSFENKGKGGYQITGWGENKKSVVFQGTFIYKAQEDKDYIYSGTLSYGKLYCETVMLKTGIKLSEYSGAKSVSLHNTLRFVFYSENQQGEWNWYRILKLTLLD